MTALAEVIHRGGPWRVCEQVELAPLKWVDWFKTCRLIEPIGVRWVPCPRHGFATSPQPAEAGGKLLSLP
jgi:hypothetical protein